MAAKTRAKKPKRAALYLRISKLPSSSASSVAADTSHSVEDQRVRCEQLARASGYAMVATYYDDGISAYRSRKDRPGYGDLKAALTDGLFDVLVFDRQDRLARDQTETLRFVADCKEAGIAWHSVREGQVDLTEPMQVLFAIFRSGEDEGYSTKISENARARNASKREQGLPGAGGRPFGYESDKVTLRADEADLIARGTRMLLAGAAKHEVLTEFRQSGLKTVRGSEWHPANVAALLTRWRNAGWVEHGDQPYVQAVWPAIVSRDDVEAVRAILRRPTAKGAGKWRTPTQLCSGLARCHCGHPLMVNGDDDGPAYRCSEIVSRGAWSPGGHVTIRAAILDPLVRDAVVDSYFTRPAGSHAAEDEAASLAKFYERREQLAAERTRVQAGYKSGIFSAAEAASEITKLDQSIATVNADIDTTAARSAHAAMLDAAMASVWFAAADRAEQGAPPFLSDRNADGLRTFDAGASLMASMSREGLSRDEAVNAAQAMFWQGNPEEPEQRAELARRFDALPLEQRRSLVRALVTVTVRPGRGAGRVTVEPV